MTDIINKLSELFSVRNSVDKEINEILESLKTHKTCPPLVNKIVIPSKASEERKCVSCGKTVLPGKYLSKGKCAGCYSRERYQNAHGIKGRERKEREYYCDKCDLNFKSNLPKLDCTCPKCGNVRVVLAQ